MENTHKTYFSVIQCEHKTLWPHPHKCSKPTYLETIFVLLTLALHFFSLQMDDEPFNPDYVEVDRVLDVSESTDENGEVL